MRWLTVVALISLTVGARADGIAWHESFPAALTAAQVSGKPLLTLFVGEGCGPCDELQTITLVDPEVIGAAAGFEAVIVNTFTERPLATHFLVSTVPTVKFLHVDGTVVFDNTGFASPEQFVGVLAHGLAAHQALLRARKAAAEADDGLAAEAALAIARDFAFAWQHSEAAQWAERALDTAPEDAIALRAEALLIRGRALIEVGEPHLAADALTEHLRLAPDNPDLWAARLALGKAWLQAGETEAGTELLKAVYAAPEAGEDAHAEAKRLLFWAGVDVE